MKSGENTSNDLLLSCRVKYNYNKGEVMKVIFLESVANVARAGEIKEVADGYGRNFLIPKGLAMLASSSVVKTVEIQRRIKAKEEAILATETLELANQLEGREITLKAKVGAKDRLYGSVTNADIASELEKTTELVIDKRKIELDEPIRQLGSYEVAIRLAKDAVPKIKVNVIEQETDKETKKTEEETKKTKETKRETVETEGENKETNEETKEETG